MHANVWPRPAFYSVLFFCPFNCCKGQTILLSSRETLVQSAIGARLCLLIFPGRIKNPILAAEAVLEKSEHCLLASEGGLRFAEANGLEIVEAEDLISPRGAKSYETKKRTEGKGGKIRADEGISNEMPGER